MSNNNHPWCSACPANFFILWQHNMRRLWDSNLSGVCCWRCCFLCACRLLGGADVCDGQPGPAGSHTHGSVLSPSRAARPEDLTAPPLPPLGVPQSWAHHGRMLLQTQTRWPICSPVSGGGWVSWTWKNKQNKQYYMVFILFSPTLYTVKTNELFHKVEISRQLGC